MSASTVAVIALLVFVWALLSGVLPRHSVTGPLLFVVAGYLLSNTRWGPLPVHIQTESIHLVAEATLGLILFSDASRINVRELRHDLSLPLRLLGIGLGLSVLIGAVLAAALLAGLPWALAGFVGAALAPTDAALSVQVITDQRIPMRLRRALNVESGLNDGIVTPIVTVMLAIAASQLGVVHETTSSEALDALKAVGVGVGIGVGTGIVGATLISLAARRGWIASGGQRVAALAVAGGAIALALAMEGNAFIAAFVAGLSFGAALDKKVTDLDRINELPELSGEILALVVWYVFGAALLPFAFDAISIQTVGYALLSLTVVRMVPVAISLLRSGLDLASVVFIGWFGPRGLASVVFAVLAVEELGLTGAAAPAVSVVALTVTLSIVLHGATAAPGGQLYVRQEKGVGPEPRARSRYVAR